MVHTQVGKLYALEMLRKRRSDNAGKKPPDNALLPAGAPMYYACIACGESIVVLENWVTKSDLCRECMALFKLGWLDE